MSATWSAEASAYVTRLKDQKLGYQALKSVDYQLNMVMHESDLSRQQDPVGIFELKIGDPANSRVSQVCLFVRKHCSYTLLHHRVTKHCNLSSITQSYIPSFPNLIAYNNSLMLSVDELSNECSHSQSSAIKTVKDVVVQHLLLNTFPKLKLTDIQVLMSHDAKKLGSRWVDFVKSWRMERWEMSRRR